LKKIFYKILLTANVFFAFALLISYLAVHISPENFALPAFFGLAYPYLLLVNIIFILVWAVLLRYEALISVLVIALGFTHLLNYIKIGKTPGSKEGTFKVLSYNLRLFNNFEKKGTNSETKILTFLKGQQPDILCLQEFFMIGNPAEKDQLVKTALGAGYYSHMKVYRSGKDRYNGIVTYSKFPIVRKGEIIHPGSSSLSIFTDVIIENDTFRIFNNHLQPFRLKGLERSFFEEMTTNGSDETLDEIKSLSLSLKKGFVLRALQARAVKAQVNLSPYPVIVAGDINDTPVSYSYSKIRKGLNDSFVSSGYGAGFTYKGNYPSNRIDYILYDNALESRYFEILKVRFSDHYPVVAYFRKRN